MTSWIMSEGNSALIEILPEEALGIGVTIQSPLISEPAFRILVNEQAMLIAGGLNDARRPTTTILGRKISDRLSGDAFRDDLSQRIEHAGTMMADRIMCAVNDLQSGEILDKFNLVEWQKIKILGESISRSAHAHVSFSSIREAHTVLHQGIKWCFITQVRAAMDYMLINNEDIRADDARRRYIATRELVPYDLLYGSLNDYQRALCATFWRRLSFTYDQYTSTDRYGWKLWDLNNTFNDLVGSAVSRGEIVVDTNLHWDIFPHGNITIDLFSLGADISTAVRVFAAKMLDRNTDFPFWNTPHLLVSLKPEEMAFMTGNQAMFQVPIPPATGKYGQMTPIGPGPSFHTGMTVAPSESAELSVLGSDTFSGGFGEHPDTRSAVVQDGNSTVHDRHEVLTQTLSIYTETERFSATSDGAYTDARVTNPAPHQFHTAAVEAIAEDLPQGQLWDPADDSEGLYAGDSHNDSVDEDTEDGNGEWQFDIVHRNNYQNSDNDNVLSDALGSGSEMFSFV